MKGDKEEINKNKSLTENETMYEYSKDVGLLGFSKLFLSFLPSFLRTLLD